MRKSALFFLLLFFPLRVWAAPISANGFECLSVKGGVRCEGKFPGSETLVQKEGPSPVHISADVKGETAPVHYAYFSETGCLIGYTLNNEGKREGAAVIHRSGEKKTFVVKKNGYRKIIDFCRKEIR